MAITFTPSRGDILICHFDMATVPPEMRKTRRVAVVSPRSFNRSGRSIVVPFSASEPKVLLLSHVPIAAGSCASLGKPVWAICDCVAHVSDRSLDRVLHRGGYITEQIGPADLDRIGEGLRHAIGLI